MRAGHLSSITGIVDLPPDGVTEGAFRATGVSPSGGGDKVIEIFRKEFH